MKHGHTGKNYKSKTWSAWHDMRARCQKPKHAWFFRYGARGISVCKGWDVFANFLADMGEAPIGTCLDRINNNGNYCPENCRWVTPKQSAQNRCTSRFLIHKGKRKTIAEWADFYGHGQATIAWRLKAGWSIRDALEVKSGARRAGDVRIIV